MTSDTALIGFGVTLGSIVGLCLYIVIAGATARWWFAKKLKRATNQGKYIDAIEARSVREDSVVIGIFWPGTFPYFFVAWSAIGSSIARFVLWTWRFTTVKPKLPKAELPKAEIVNREKKS